MSPLPPPPPPPPPLPLLPVAVPLGQQVLLRDRLRDFAKEYYDLNHIFLEILPVMKRAMKFVDEHDDDRHPECDDHRYRQFLTVEFRRCCGDPAHWDR
jgi:hypothetical protein